jgi:hypothetical protein
MVLFFLVVPSLFLGWQENWQSLQSWYRQMIVPFVLQGTVTSEHNNQSLPGLVQRLATHSPSFSTYENGQYKPLAYHNFVDLDPAVARWVVKGCLIAFAVLVVWVCRTPRTTGGGRWRLAAEYSLIVLGMLLFSERTWKHHCVTLVLPFGVLCYYLASCRPGPMLRVYLIGTLATVSLLMLATGVLQSDRDTELTGVHGWAEMAQVYGAYVWGYLLLMTSLVVVLKRPDPASDGDVARCVPPIAGSQARIAV